jgi:hypothetical protein
MRARFVSRFEWQGMDIYCYDDLDTGEVVYLNGGRNGSEVRRYTPVRYCVSQGRAVDVPMRKNLFDYIKKNYLKPVDPYKGKKPYDHWA